MLRVLQDGVKIIDSNRLENMNYQDDYTNIVLGHTQPDYPDPNLPDSSPEPSRDKLVFITHGWNTPQKSFDSYWIGFQQAIANRISQENDASEWVVTAYDWTEHCDTLWPIDPTWALRKAYEIGFEVGEGIYQHNYKFVHFIAHSAGSGMILSATEKIKELAAADSRNVTVHCTFLDPYTGSIANEAIERYGRAANWAENYYSEGILPWTQPKLKHAHNVELDAVDPGIDNHGFPCDWYYATITGSYPDGVPLGTDNQQNGTSYGYPLSYESGWRDFTFPVGNEPVKIGSGETGNYQAVTEREDNPLNIQASGYSTSTTGTVTVSNESVELISTDTAWISIPVSVTELSNYIVFNLEFISAEGAEGIVTVQWEENALGLIDERYELSGLQEQYFELGKTYQPGTYELKLRVDSFTTVPTQIQVDNIRTGVSFAVCDLVIDSKIDFKDFVEFASKWGQTGCSETNNYCDFADIDQMGSVDIIDMATFAENWLEGTK